MKTLLIVYHSFTGGSLAMAQAVGQGAACEPGIQILVRHASEADGVQVCAADGLVFVTPETLGSMAGVMKDFFDRSYYPALGQINGRPYAVLVCAGSDGQGAVRQIQKIATGLRLKQVAEPLIVCTHAQTPEAIAAPKQIAQADLQRCRDTGAAMAAGMMMGLF
jgi:multimeric flavodoxin WrbA